MGEKALVLGASGFIGSYLLQELHKKKYKVSALIHKSKLKEKEENIKIFRGSLSDFDWTRLEKDLPDVIFHTARMSGNNKKARQMAAVKNEHANRNLLHWLNQLDNPPLLVYASGTLVYGHGSEKLTDENAAIQPISFQREYFQAEQPLLQAISDKQLPLMILRPAWVYGPDSWLKVFYLNYMHKKKKVPIYGAGENLMSFIHVRDVAGMMIHAAESGKAGEIFNLFTSKAIPQSEFAEMLSSLSGLPIRKVPLWWVKLRYDKAVAEAFDFSLKLTSIHEGFYNSYQPYYPDIENWFRKYLNKT